MPGEERRLQKAFPICGCRYCPNAHLRHAPPYCGEDGADAGEVLDERFLKEDGVFPDFCPLDNMQPREKWVDDTNLDTM